MTRRVAGFIPKPTLSIALAAVLPATRENVPNGCIPNGMQNNNHPLFFPTKRASLTG